MILPDPDLAVDRDPQADADALGVFLDALICMGIVGAVVLEVLVLLRPAMVALPVDDWRCTRWRDTTVSVQTDRGAGRALAYACEQWSRR